MTKEKVLKLFERNKGKILSGEQLAQQMGMSRAAIWKVINGLREEGYDIESIRKKGYRLNVNSDILSIIKIKDHLEEGVSVAEIELHKSIDSTNKRLKQLALEGAKEWTIVASEEQRAGKARGYKPFLSPEGKGVYMSILLKPKINWEDREPFLLMVYEAVTEVLESLACKTVCRPSAGDFCIDNKKVAGILTEMNVEGETGLIESMVVGIGINIYDERQGNEIDDIELALSQVKGEYCNRSEIISSIINELSKRIQ